MINLLGKQESLLEALRQDINETVGDFFSKLRGGELTEFLGREPYERLEATANHRNGFYDQ
ncbi:MAG: hypothetical protein A2508_04860 [Candidatus Lambdaproteobacteria bacterium RIFOXYD12_FULL_49_8]|uniref:Uncharacterized protein n=1 Tax=Candidatus Lambdaproteobacteria bacterium RIFOXYD2_FULL_50_16 TaxID=1817772 RepID=A0A1F6G9A6_9PROT|nr:MAG: hypothetical protein A2527_05610 [Candidatus Lambdaproteobacteria bacterium RIFOXYD2_FULL_50_16]OGG97351.1 MAG: hypothetical protein A2508_04860 [Candidatus Lambdaproteobacteria bacterium RIFOXYD12_FULL_49_8]